MKSPQQREERRSSVRSPTDDPASLHVLNPLSSAHSKVRVVEVSQEGLKLRVPELLHPGTMVQVRFRDRIVLGEVRYCLPAGAEFYIGVQIRDVFPNP